MAALDRLAIAHGRLSDFKAVWWPFVFLKPDSANTPITQKRILAMVPCFAAWFLLAWMIREWLLRDAGIPPAGELLKIYGYFVLGFLVWFNVVTAPLWNRRVKILRRS
ncbi:MAG: hypothetical protein ACI9R3_000763 [Verrucomicrobiales bacterium]